MTLERGSLLNNRYRIVEILGQGGMAAVYRAIDENLGVQVAVKENLFTTDEYARQFRLEAVILASLRQPNLPRVTDHFVIEDQGQYLVMDFIEGEDLRQRLDRTGPLSDEEVILIGAAVCDALGYLHTRKPPVIHRDVKPGNVKIAPNGHIFLVDFGLAKVVQNTNVTTTGARAMTPGYSPPEQYGTAHTDERTDIYSLGATLYSALTDALPEDGLARAMDQADLTPARKRNPKIGRRLATAIEKALEVKPDNRYQTADEFKQDLLNARGSTRRKTEFNVPPPPEEEIVIEEGVDFDDVAVLNGSSKALMPLPAPVIDTSFQPPRARKRKQRGWLLIPLLLLLALASCALAYALRPDWTVEALAWFLPSPTPTPTRFSIPPTSTSSLANPATPQSTRNPLPATPTPTLPPAMTFTPTASATLAHTSTPTASLTPTAAPTPFGGGKGQIAFASDRTGIPQIWLMNADGTGLSQLTDIAEGACQPSWSPDGARLVFISPCPKARLLYRGSSMFIINADGTGLSPLPSAPGGDYDPDWSPDGKFIAFTSERDKLQIGIYILNLDDFSVVALPDPEIKPGSQPAWSPDGKYLAYVRSLQQIWAMTKDGLERHLVTRGSSYQNTEPNWSPFGQSMVCTQNVVGVAGNYWLATVLDSPEGNVPVIIAQDMLMGHAQYSADGFWLVFEGWPNQTNHDVYIMTPTGVGRQPLTDHPGYDFDPTWRP
jgi:serine/threonine protein kinase